MKFGMILYEVEMKLNENKMKLNENASWNWIHQIKVENVDSCIVIESDWCEVFCQKKAQFFSALIGHIP